MLLKIITRKKYNPRQNTFDNWPPYIFPYNSMHFSCSDEHKCVGVLERPRYVNTGIKMYPGRHIPAVPQCHMTHRAPLSLPPAGTNVWFMLSTVYLYVIISPVQITVFGRFLAVIIIMINAVSLFSVLLMAT